MSKARIQETKNLLTDANIRSDIILERLRGLFIYFYCIFERLPDFYQKKNNKKKSSRENPGKTLGKPWENARKTLGKPQENPGTTPGKPWENPKKTSGNPGKTTGTQGL